METFSEKSSRVQTNLPPSCRPNDLQALQDELVIVCSGHNLTRNNPINMASWLLVENKTEGQ